MCDALFESLFRCRNVFRTTALLLAVSAFGLTSASFAAVTVDFRQSANDETNGSIQGLGNIHWINSIVQASNSRYFEGMDNFQRTIITGIPATTSNIHTMSISHQFTKGGIHAYDFLVSWPQAEADDEAALGLPGPPIVMSLNECGDEIGPPNTLDDTCSNLRAGGFFLDVVVPDDPYISKDGSTASRIAAYEAVRGNRTIRIYGNQPMSAGSLTICHDVAAGADDGDSYAHYVLQWTSTSSRILVEMAGHLAISDDGTGMSWGAGLGSGQINGGPYHFKLGQIGGAVASTASCPSTLTQVVSLGSQDNQIKGGDIIVPCPTCLVSGPTGPFCPGSASQSYSVDVNGTCSDQSTITWSLSNNTSGASFNGGNTGTTVSVNPGSSCGGFTLTSSFTCSNCTADPVTCFVDVTVEDNTNPTVTFCPPNAAINCPATPVFGTPTFSDNCDQSLTIASNDVTTPGTCPQEYSVTRTTTATDDCGNSATCVQIINVVDDTPPVLSGQGADASIECPAVPVFTAPTASDLCDPDVPVDFSDATTPGLCPQEYSITRTWTAVDDCGNQATPVSQTITVEDNTPPVLSGQGADASIECPSVPDFTAPTASDLCDLDVPVNFSDETTPGSCPQEYSVTRTWTAVDDCGNQATPVSQTITVTDNTPPVLSGEGADASIECPSVPDFTAPTASDLCDPDVPVNFSDETTPGSCPQEYSVTRTWTAVDDCGNQATPVSQTITVTDNTPPVITCPADATFNCTAGGTGEATAVDACDPDPDITFSDEIVSTTCPAIVNRTWVATDACGNSSSCVQVITVVDNDLPSITCPDPVTVQCFADVPAPDVDDVIASDNCGIVNVTFEGDVPSGTCPTIITRTYKATDACLNSRTCTQTITVDDTTPPILSGCPSNTSVQCLANVPPPASVTSEDNCDGAIVPVFTEAQSNPGSSCNNVITRTWTATDACENVASCTQIITVNDNTPPLLTACPANIEVCPNVPVNFTDPTATDNCDGVVPVVCVRSDNLGFEEPYPVGTTTITCSAQDACGNSASCSFTVTVNDNPSCTIFDGPGFGSPVCAGSAVAINNLFCGPVGMTSYSWSVDCGTIDGATDEQCVSWIPPSDGSLCTFSLVVVDNNGCTSTCTRAISVPASTPCVPLPPPDPLPFCGSSGNQYCVDASLTITNVTVSCADWSVVSWVSNCFIYNAGNSAGPCEFLIDATNAVGCPTSCVVSFGCQPAGQGCTPGYWKNHKNLWNQASDDVSICVAAAISGLGAPYSGNGTTGSLFRSTFGLSSAQMTAAGLSSNLTLAQAIDLGAGCFFKLARHAVAALLSSCAVNYPLSTTDVLTQVHNAFVSLQCEPLATNLAQFNEMNCPLNKDGTSSATLSEADETVEDVLPTEFGLNQNYPNPFNPSTEISFSIPMATHVTIEIFNIMGQQVSLLVDGHREAGTYTVDWDGSSVASGVYFYRLTTPEFVQTKKMLLMK